AVRWISGHDGVAGNEAVDEEAKKAARSSAENSPRERLPPYLRKGIMPSSISALKQAQRQESVERWARSWSQSPRFEHASRIDPRTLSGSF
ncbi:hypothetical protein DEU56DRAFT_701564, partial [Suillus clintonianus]|uniref:uncharacterized protein n=1 Tax=Suillus clintonianus TaxID=1904413 RepID=UPI001B860A65